MYADIIVRIKNAEQARKAGLLAPFSKLGLAIAKVLVESGHALSVEKKTMGKKDFLDIRLIKGKGGAPAISGFRIISKPSRRIYVDYRNIRPVKQGYGIGVISTPLGVMSNKEARKKKVGGEYLLEVW